MTDQTITGILRYRVPDHQDHAVLRAALLQEGYAPSSEMSQAEMFLLIPCTGDREVERERVRTILQDVHKSSLSGPDLIYTVVRFDDEPQDDRDGVDERPASAQGSGGRTTGTRPDGEHPLRELVRGPQLGRFRTRVVPAALGAVAVGAAGYAVTGADRRRRGLVVAAGAAVVAAVAASLGRAD